MQRTHSLLALLALTAVCIAGARASSGSPVALSVNGTEVTLETFQAELARVAAAGGAPSRLDPLSFADTYVQKLVLAREAHDVVPEGAIALEIDDAVRRVIVERYKQAKLDTIDTSPERLEQLFTMNQDHVVTRHIVRETRAEAESVLTALRAGADFEELARRTSIDEPSREYGGLWGWLSYGHAIGVDDLAWSLAFGEIGGPVKGARGWHIVRLEDRQGREVLPLMEKHRDVFMDAYPQKLGDRRWREWYRLALDRHEVELDTLAHAAVCSLLMSGVREAPPELRDTIIARGEALTFSAEDAFDAWRVSTAPGPSGPTIGYYRLWLNNELRDRMIVREARAEGIADRPEVRAAIADAVELQLVEALYRRKVRAFATPDSAGLREYFEANRGAFQWRESLDLSIFRTAEEAMADSLAALLSEAPSGHTANEIADLFPDVDVRRTGLTVDIDALPQASVLIRQHPREVGEIVGPTVADGAWTTIRVEAIGEPTPMTFEETLETGVLRTQYTGWAIERRFATYLDSLRTVHHARIDTAVVRRAVVPTPDTAPAAP
jgi:hypothetical protein